MLVEDLLPYRTLRHQLPFVMVSHAAYPQVTVERTPASLSKKWISDILRKRIRYGGLIVSDDLEMERSRNSLLSNRRPCSISARVAIWR